MAKKSAPEKSTPVEESVEAYKPLTQEEFWAQRRKEGLTQGEIDAARRSLPPIVPMTDYERQQITGLSPDDFAEADEDAIKNSRPTKEPLPLWFKALCVAVLAVPIMYFVGKSYYDSYENIEDKDWQKFMDQGCRPTMHGSLKRFFYNELALWSHINGSMDSWERDTRGDERICDIEYSEPSQLVQRQQCLARFEAKLEWYARCIPVVLTACRQSGGNCQ